MNCRSAEDLFSPFLEEELSQEERRELESHLDGCRRCSTAIEELRATVALMASLPSYETGPHFEEEVMDRIRSGEALRPTLVEWLAQWLQPARLRPVFLTGAAACAAWIAFLVMNPTAQVPMLAHNTAPASATSSAAKPSPALPSGSETIASAPAPVMSGVPSTSASAPVVTPRNNGAFRAASETSIASRSSSQPADSAVGNDDSTPYQDEYILDQFYLNRSSEDGVHSIVPVTGRPSDDVYITF
ncbi:MAG TPA: zf-HC2 domain-containing protein [Candidatus Eisenbacteria bacterium]|nr:zf-HC2 domain-containing protein [Candidatus Eisenbacteria bacterium]